MDICIEGHAIVLQEMEDYNVENLLSSIPLNLENKPDFILVNLVFKLPVWMIFTLNPKKARTINESEYVINGAWNAYAASRITL